MSSPSVNLSKALSSESLNSRQETSQQRISLQHIFNSCVLDRNQRVNAGELIRHFRFVAEQNSDLLSIQFDFAFLLNQLGGSDQQVTFDQLFNAVEKLYTQLVDKSSVSTPSTSKSISSMSSVKKRRNKENIDAQPNDDQLDSRRKSNDHEKCKIDSNELIEINRRQTERLKMLEDEYKKLEDDHHRLLNQYEDIQKKKLLLEDDLNRYSRYMNENVDLHVYKNQLETSYRDLKEMNESCEREKFELQEQIIDMENQLQNLRFERDQFINKFTDIEQQFKCESTLKQQFEEQLTNTQNQLKENNQVIGSLKKTVEDLNCDNQDLREKNIDLEKTIEELRQQLRNAKTESIEARLSLSNLCDEESFLCDELEQRVDVSRRITISNGQSLFAEINSIDNISNECVSQCLDSSNMETIDDMEVQILLSKSDSFNCNHLKDLFHELHINGVNINENFVSLLNIIQCDREQDDLTMKTTSIEKSLLIIKNLLKKIIDNKDVFEGRFRKLQSLLIASREKQQKFQCELNEFSEKMKIDVTSANVIDLLKDSYRTIEQMKSNEQLFEEKIQNLEEQFQKDKREIFHENVLSNEKIRSRKSNLTNGICPFHSIRELLHDDHELFHSTSAYLPCRCLNRSRSTPAIRQILDSDKHVRRLSSPTPSIPTDSGLNTSTVCTTSRSQTPELNDDASTMTFHIDSLYNRTLTKENGSIQSKDKKITKKKNRSIYIKSDRVKRVLKRLQWCAIITSCSIVLFLWSVIIRYYCLTSVNDDDCNRLSFAWWPFAYCSTNGITL